MQICWLFLLLVGLNVRTSISKVPLRSPKSLGSGNIETILRNELKIKMMLETEDTITRPIIIHSSGDEYEYNNNKNAYKQKHKLEASQENYIEEGFGAVSYRNSKLNLAEETGFISDHEIIPGPVDLTHNSVELIHDYLQTRHNEELRAAKAEENWYQEIVLNANSEIYRVDTVNGYAGTMNGDSVSDGEIENPLVFDIMSNRDNEREEQEEHIMY